MVVIMCHGIFGEKDTRFKGSREMPEQPVSPLLIHDIDLPVKIHNWVDSVFKARVFLSRLSGHSADNNLNP
jgi:hypothetical protein